MPLLIDGYNLLYATGIVGRGSGPGGPGTQPVGVARTSWPIRSIRRTCRTRPWCSTPTTPRRGCRGRCSTGASPSAMPPGYESADALIEELIRAESAPRRLVVVSSDREIQRAARRRRAKAVASDAWYAELLRARRERNEAAAEPPDQPPVPLLAEDVEYWIRQFGGAAVAERVGRDPAGRRAVQSLPRRLRRGPAAGAVARFPACVHGRALCHCLEQAVLGINCTGGACWSSSGTLWSATVTDCYARSRSSNSNSASSMATEQ